MAGDALINRDFQEWQRRVLDPNFILEIATGWEDEEIIAQRFGFSPVEFTKIQRFQPYISEVSRVRAQLEKDGRMAQNKARLMALDILEQCYAIAMNEDTKLDDKLEALRVIAKLADMEPKANQKTASGPAFSITLNLPQNQEPLVIESESVLSDDQSEEDRDV